MIPFLDLYEASTPIAPAVPGSIPFDVFSAKLLELYTPELRSRTTRRQLVHALGVLTELGVERTSDLTPSVIATLVRTRDPKLSPHSVKTLLRYCQVICTHAFKTHVLDVNPFDVRPVRSWGIRARPSVGRHLSKEEARALLTVLAADVRDKRGLTLWYARRLEAMVATALFTALRLSELTHLMVVDVDLAAERVIEVVSRPDSKLKTEKAAQPLICPTALIPILSSWLKHRDDSPDGLTRAPSVYVFRNWDNGNPWTTGSTGHKPLCRLKALAARAGLTGVTWQALRRTVATNMESSCSDAMIMRVLRHTNPQTSQRFYRAADLKNLHSAMDSFSYD